MPFTPNESVLPPDGAAEPSGSQPKPGHEPRDLRYYTPQMLAMADRLFSDHDDLPVADVFRAISAARSRLRGRDQLLPDPQNVEGLARELLAMTRTQDPGPYGRIADWRGGRVNDIA